MIALSFIDVALYGLAFLGSAALVGWLVVIIWFVCLTQAIGEMDEDRP